MFTSIPSLDPVLQCLLPAFTQPSFQTHVEVLLGWAMCLSKRTEYGVFQTIQADTPVSRKQRHPFDRFYNFFSRSAWTVHDLAHQLAVAIVVKLNPRGLLYLVVAEQAWKFRISPSWLGGRSILHNLPDLLSHSQGLGRCRNAPCHL